MAYCQWGPTWPRGPGATRKPIKLIKTTSPLSAKTHSAKNKPVSAKNKLNPVYIPVKSTPKLVK